MNSTLSFTILHLLLMTYMALPFAITLLLFRDNEYAFYAMLILEGVLWAIAIYTVITKVRAFQNSTTQLLSNVTAIARG